MNACVIVMVVLLLVGLVPHLLKLIRTGRVN